MRSWKREKKLARRARRLHNEAKDEPRPWWSEDEPWEPSHVKVARQRAYYKRREQKRVREGWRGYGRYRWYNDFGVTTTARKRKRHRRHEIKPYQRPTKT